MKRILGALLAALVLTSGAMAQSTINPANPPDNSAILSPVVRQSFAATIHDINCLYATGCNPTSYPASPLIGQIYTYQAGNPWLTQQWDGSHWNTVWTTDPVSGVVKVPLSNLPTMDFPLTTSNVDGEDHIGVATGDSGHVIPYLDGNNSYSGTANFSQDVIFQSNVFLGYSSAPTNLKYVLQFWNGSGYTSGFTGQVAVSQGVDSAPAWLNINSLMTGSGGIDIGGGTTATISCATAASGTPGCVTPDGNAAHVLLGTGAFGPVPGGGGGSGNVPAGGSTGQVLAKASGADYDTAWFGILSLTSQDVQTCGTTAGCTWSKPVGAAMVIAEGYGGGGGGASGYVVGNDAPLQGFGGGGGDGALLTRCIYRASDLPASVTMFVGDGGVGGTAISVTNPTAATQGTPGSPGGVSFFADCGAAGGLGGTVISSSSSSASPGGGAGYSNQAGGGSPTSANSIINNGRTFFQANGGGAGSYTDKTITTTAGYGGSLSSTHNSAGGANDTAGAMNGANATDPGAGGGGGGSARTQTTAGSGGTGLNGGGGGGGGSVHTTASTGTWTSGAGGKGGVGSWKIMTLQFAP